MDVTSTLRNLNLQLSRLFYHSGGVAWTEEERFSTCPRPSIRDRVQPIACFQDCRGENITIAVELDDLGSLAATKQVL